jgi:oxygen-independent coproporphyrinogen-3 oxidase
MINRIGTHRYFNFAILACKSILQVLITTTLAGIYLHIPFCKQACHYCNFHFTTSLRYKKEVVDAMAKEILLQKEYLKDEIVETIYFGGGTPSLLSVQEIQVLLDRIKNTFNTSANAEVTLETNPDDIQKSSLYNWKESGINRLSIGIQSFYEEELVWMNRAHSVQQSHQCIELSLEAGFTNITIDLIYGSPLLTNDMWRNNIQTAIDYGISHLSCYALTVEEKTPLHKHIETQIKPDVDQDKQGNQFLLLMQWLKAAGYEHYEVSNFAKPGFRSKHNSAYWKGKSYLGIGPSAHSFNGKVRQWNIANNQQYIGSLSKSVIPAEKEILSDVDQLNEYIMISLRTMEGIDLSIIESKWGITQKERLIQESQKYISNGVLLNNTTHLKLNESGMPLADGIASALFL